MSTNAIAVRLAPVADEPPPSIKMTGTGKDIPVVRWASGHDVHCEVTLEVGNHNDPATYLRETANQLLKLADQVDGAQGVTA